MGLCGSPARSQRPAPPGTQQARAAAPPHLLDPLEELRHLPRGAADAGRQPLGHDARDVLGEAAARHVHQAADVGGAHHLHAVAHVDDGGRQQRQPKALAAPGRGVVQRGARHLGGGSHSGRVAWGWAWQRHGWVRRGEQALLKPSRARGGLTSRTLRTREKPLEWTPLEGRPRMTSPACGAAAAWAQQGAGLAGRPGLGTGTDLSLTGQGRACGLLTPARYKPWWRHPPRCGCRR